MDTTGYAAYTVLHIAHHFESMRPRAEHLAESASASERGYFTPREDDEVKHMLVSYMQSRNALIELLLEYRDAELSEEERPRRFLVAFAGALVLVNGARFLRDQFHSRPIVRAKLNEPIPTFGIEGGSYELIQRSLTNPIHAWHLYHAYRYFQNNTDTLRNCNEEPFPQLFALCNELLDRLKVSKRTFALARVRAGTRKLSRVVQKDIFGRALYGIQKTISALMADLYVRSGHEPGLPDRIQSELREMLRPGDIIITRKEHAVTNYFLPGYWPHAAFYWGSLDELQQMGLDTHEHFEDRWEKLVECDRGDDRRVIEAMKDGVHMRSLASPFRSDAVTILRPQLETTYIGEAIARGAYHEGKPYDFDFDFERSDRLVCTEVVYRSFDNVGGIQFDLSRRAGRWTLAAVDLIRMSLNGHHFDPIAVYAPTHDENVVGNERVHEILERTLE